MLGAGAITKTEAVPDDVAMTHHDVHTGFLLAGLCTVEVPAGGRYELNLKTKAI